MTVFAAATGILATALLAAGVDLQDVVGDPITTSDSLRPAPDPSDDASACLAGLCWEPTSFRVDREASADADRGDVVVRFPSPIDRGLTVNDRVALEWFVACSGERPAVGEPMTAPAIVVVHESGRGMTAGRAFARSLRFRGFHTFLIHLPHYGLRRTESPKTVGPEMFDAFRQGIADVRRAHDAVAALPFIDDTTVALQGTSLGGILSATVAGIDDGYDAVYLMLAGGDIDSILRDGRRDAAKIRSRLIEAGLSNSAIAELAASIEPTRLAHRIRRDRLWMFSASYDSVVPPTNARALASAARLSSDHHAWMPVTHYSGVAFFPVVVDAIARSMQQLPRAAERP